MTPSGSVQNETVMVDGFTSIDVQDVAHVFISEGATQEISVDAEQEILDRMEIVVENGELRIKLDGCFDGNFTFDVFVTIPTGTTLEKVEVSGAGEVTTSSSIEVSDDFSLELSGAANVTFETKIRLLNSTWKFRELEMLM